MPDDLTPSQERAVRLALRCASLSMELDKVRTEAGNLQKQLVKAMAELERVGVALELEDANREERSA